MRQDIRKREKERIKRSADRKIDIETSKAISNLLKAEILLTSTAESYKTKKDALNSVSVQTLANKIRQIREELVKYRK